MVKKLKFGSVTWQNEMNKGIAKSIMQRKKLTPEQKTFIAVQHLHKVRLAKKEKFV